MPTRACHAAHRQVLDEGSDWKGRRETVVALKDTIRKLREERVCACSCVCRGKGLVPGRTGGGTTKPAGAPPSVSRRRGRRARVRAAGVAGRPPPSGGCTRPGFGDRLAAPCLAPQGSAAPTKHDEAHRNTIGRLAKERAAEAEALRADLAAARGAVEAARRQYAGASSRRKVVEGEVGVWWGGRGWRKGTDKMCHRWLVCH